MRGYVEQDNSPDRHQYKSIFLPVDNSHYKLCRRQLDFEQFTHPIIFTWTSLLIEDVLM